MVNHKSVIEFGIISLGRFGTALAENLIKEKKEIIAIDTIESRVRKLGKITDNVFVVPNYEKMTLEDAGIQNCDTVIICIGDSIDISILTALNVISMGVRRVIARAMSYEQGLILEKIGAEVIYPESDMAERLSRKLTNFSIVESIMLSSDTAIMELKLNGKINGMTIQQANLRQKYHLNIIALEHQGSTITDIPPEMELHADDNLVVVGSIDNIHKFQQYLEKP